MSGLQLEFEEEREYDDLKRQASAEKRRRATTMPPSHDDPSAPQPQEIPEAVRKAVTLGFLELLFETTFKVLYERDVLLYEAGLNRLIDQAKGSGSEFAQTSTVERQVFRGFAEKGAECIFLTEYHGESRIFKKVDGDDIYQAVVTEKFKDYKDIQFEKDGETVRIVVHLPSDKKKQKVSMAELADWVKELWASGAYKTILIGGDFNANITEEAYFNSFEEGSSARWLCGLSAETDCLTVNKTRSAFQTQDRKALFTDKSKKDFFIQVQQNAAALACSEALMLHTSNPWFQPAVGQLAPSPAHPFDHMAVYNPAVRSGTLNMQTPDLVEFVYDADTVHQSARLCICNRWLVESAHSHAMSGGLGPDFARPEDMKALLPEHKKLLAAGLNKARTELRNRMTEVGGFNILVPMLCKEPQIASREETAALDTLSTVGKDELFGALGQNSSQFFNKYEQELLNGFEDDSILTKALPLVRRMQKFTTRAPESFEEWKVAIRSDLVNDPRKLKQVLSDYQAAIKGKKIDLSSEAGSCVSVFTQMVERGHML